MAVLSGSDLAALVALLRSLPADAAVHAAGWKRLAQLTRDSKPHQAVAGEAGACAVLVAALTQHRLDAAVAQQACGAVGNLACLSANKERAGAAGACEAVAAVLTTHRDNAQVAEYACQAVGILTYNHAANKQSAGAAGACEAVAAVLTTHRDNAAVAQEACRAMLMLTALPANQERAGAAGACEAVAAVLTTHRASAEVAKQACSPAARAALFRVGPGHETETPHAQLGGTAGHPARLLITALRLPARPCLDVSP